MVGITAANLNIPSVAGATPAATSNASPGTPTVDERGGLAFKGDAFKSETKAAQLESSLESNEEPAIKEQREQIKRLQKQLAEEQKQLAQLMEQARRDPSKMAAVTAKQASIATLTGLIMAATAQLLEALRQSGGNSAGGSVDTSA
ncbi:MULTISPECIES: hypothetical protein [Pseudomonas]|jgi:molecular chaperone GrpE (heat shock protein)|uniref:FlxA-like protein n=1 Tax=Pseudomonas soli TaxID=1306993 RepID=A0A2V4J225_9PSED|nr:MULTISPECIES: hypothetical protein [Pseudomonas]PYB83566.1 hypothetical protein DMX07_09935 [Pseudomonas soli]PZW81499.1 hypothetical protein DFS21_105365 [Pseudomonas sp. 2848]QWA30678.1 hypothetical protein KHO27_07315 [Pseudomonas sp. RC3H12]